MNSAQASRSTNFIRGSLVLVLAASCTAQQTTQTPLASSSRLGPGLATPGSEIEHYWRTPSPLPRQAATRQPTSTLPRTLPDTHDARTLVHTAIDRLGYPESVLYTHSGYGSPTDIGDFRDVAFVTLLLLYPGDRLAIEVGTPCGELEPTGETTARLHFSLVEFSHEDCWARGQVLQTEDLYQLDVLYRDLPRSAGTTVQDVLDALLHPQRGVTVETRFPTADLTPGPALTLADFTQAQPLCQLPCWNGISPGLSSSDEVVPFFERLGVSPTDIRHFHSPEGYDRFDASFETYPHTFPRRPPSVSVTTRDALVQTVSIGGLDFQGFIDFRHMLDALGAPDTVSLIRISGQGFLDYILTLRYQTLQTIVQVWGTAVDDEPTICTDDVSDQPIGVIFYANSASDLIEYWLPTYDLADVAGITNLDIMNALAAPDGCIAFPSAGQLWDPYR